MINRKWTALGLCLLLCSRAFPDNIRGPLAGVVDLDVSRDQTLRGKLESLIGITLSAEADPLVQGIKLTVSGGPALIPFRNSFALYVYHDLDETPAQGRVSYRGTQTYMRFLDFEQEISFLIPLSAAHTLSPDRASFLISEENKRSDFPLLLTILPVSKGIPDSVYQQEIRFTVSPVFFNKGSMQLQVRNAEGQPIREGLYLQVDGQPVSDPLKPQVFDAGLHTLVIRSDTGMEETLQFSLSPGEKLQLDHVLQLQYPTLKIETLEGMGVSLDGKLLDRENLTDSFEIEPGDHLILFQFGEYQFSREFHAEMQGAYRITMLPEILVEKQQ